MEVVSLARQYGIYILCDEVYRFLEYKEEDRGAFICELYELGVSINVMSKSFGLPGLRIGWAASRSKLVIESIRIKIIQACVIMFLGSLSVRLL